MRKTKEGFTGINICFKLLADNSALFSGLRIHDPQLNSFHASFVVVIEEALGVRKPFESRPVLKRKFNGGGFNIRPFTGLHVKNDGLGFGKHFSRKRVNVGVCFRTKLVRRNKLQTREAPGIPGVDAVGHQFRRVRSPEYRGALLHVFRSLRNHDSKRRKRGRITPAWFAVAGQLDNFARGHVPQIKVVFPDVRSKFAVGRQQFVLIVASVRNFLAFVASAGDRACPLFFVKTEADGFSAIGEFKTVEGQFGGFEFLLCWFRECGSELRVIESRSAGVLFRIDQHEGGFH